MFIIFSQKILNANNYLSHIIYCESIINVTPKKTQELRILFVKKKKRKKRSGIFLEVTLKLKLKEELLI